MPRLVIQIPEGLPFGALRLARDPDGGVSFDTAVVVQVCEASGIDPHLLADRPEDLLAQLIVEWYRAHVAAGGAPDPVAEQIGREVQIEDHRRLN